MRQSQSRTVSIALKWLDPDSDHDLSLPAYSTDGSAGMDVCAAIDSVFIRPMVTTTNLTTRIDFLLRLAVLICI